MRSYAGVGSRSTPSVVLEQMRAYAHALALGGYTCRTGGAEGADFAFERGALRAWPRSNRTPDELLELFLPWPGFNGKHWARRDRPQPEAFAIAEQFHPAWDRLTDGGKALHARNVHQVLGYDVTEPDPVKFVVCWTVGGRGEGGTGQAIRVARAYDVPVYDLCIPAHTARFEEVLADASVA